MKRNILVFVTLIILFLNITLTLAEEPELLEEDKLVELTYVEWSSEIASTNVIKVVLEELGYEVDIMAVTAVLMWQAVANGDAAGHVAAWLPTTHELYMRAEENKVENLGPNLIGTKIGLVVPQYVTINSIEELTANAEKFEGKIIGIDPAAGLMFRTKQAIEEYQLTQFKLIEGSGSSMTRQLAKAIEHKEWIVVTGWTPHWKFSTWDLKYLEDPKYVYHPDNNKKEYIATIVRHGLKQDKPDIYRVLDNFCWTPADMEQVMVWNSKNAEPYENAKRWVNENRAKVEQWFSQTPPANNECVIDP